jgi:hypothetical protein
MPYCNAIVRPDLILGNDLALMLRPFPGDDPLSLKCRGFSVFSTVQAREIGRKYPGAVFHEDSEIIIWLFAQREEHNLLYQSRISGRCQISNKVQKLLMLFFGNSSYLRIDQIATVNR